MDCNSSDSGSDSELVMIRRILFFAAITLPIILAFVLDTILPVPAAKVIFLVTWYIVLVIWARRAKKGEEHGCC